MYSSHPVLPSVPVPAAAIAVAGPADGWVPLDLTLARAVLLGADPARPSAPQAVVLDLPRQRVAPPHRAPHGAARV